MNIATFSPMLVLFYVVVLLWTLMDVRFEELSRAQRWIIPVLIVALGIFNHMLRQRIGSATYGPMIFLTMHLPVFLVFLHLKKCGILKMVFMIFSAVVFTSPTIIIGNMIKRITVAQSPMVLLLANLATYVGMLLLAQFVFRKSFNYLVQHGDRRSILLFSLIPLLYFIYLFSVMNVDFSGMNSVSGYIVRMLPTGFALSSYFVALNVYQELNEKRELETSGVALYQELRAAEEQIDLLNKAQIQTAVYQHEMRHHLALINGFLSANKPEQAAEYVRKVQQDVEAIIPRRFCENEIANLLCSSFDGKAERMGVQLRVNAKLPKDIPIPDTELCSVVANGLENALDAVSKLGDAQRWIQFYCGIRKNNLLIEIKNPYAGKIAVRNGLPISQRENHGYGCHTIRTIAERYHGHCAFETENGVFMLRVILPLHEAQNHSE